MLWLRMFDEILAWSSLLQLHLLLVLVLLVANILFYSSMNLEVLFSTTSKEIVARTIFYS